MWSLDQPWGEMVLRAVVIYFVVFALLRLLGKKQIGESSPFDLVLLLISSEAVSNGLIGDEKSLTGALILAATLVSLNALVDYLSFKFKPVEKLIEGTACILIRDGKINEKMRVKEQITMDELDAALREHGIQDILKVKLGVLEANGKISVVPADAGTLAPAEDRLLT